MDWAEFTLIVLLVCGMPTVFVMGVLVAALCRAAGDTDEYMERRHDGA